MRRDEHGVDERVLSRKVGREHVSQQLEQRVEPRRKDEHLKNLDKKRRANSGLADGVVMILCV